MSLIHQLYTAFMPFVPDLLLSLLLLLLLLYFGMGFAAEHCPRPAVLI